MNNEFRFLMYRSAEEDVAVNAVIKDETVWLTQKAMAELFDCTTDNISLHLKNIFAEGELNKEAVTEKISATASDGKRYLTQFYNLDAIISVGYRVNSRRATHFRIWATGVLKEYMTKGFAMEEFAASVNEFLTFRRYDILPGKGHISHQAAVQKAETEYEAFNKVQAITSDFDREVKQLFSHDSQDE